MEKEEAWKWFLSGCNMYVSSCTTEEEMREEFEIWWKEEND